MKKLAFCLVIVFLTLSVGSGQPTSRGQTNPEGRSSGNDISDRLTRLEVQLEALRPLQQQVYDLKTQLVAMQGKLDNLDTKLNIVMGILVAIALPVLGEIVKRISERVAPPPPPAASGDSRTMEIFEKLIREKLAAAQEQTKTAVTGA